MFIKMFSHYDQVSAALTRDPGAALGSSALPKAHTVRRDNTPVKGALINLTLKGLHQGIQARMSKCWRI